MTSDAHHIVVIGAGQAGFSLCQALRKRGSTSRITLIGEEPYPPYERPSLSKEGLIDGPNAATRFLGDGDAYRRDAIHLRLSVSCTHIDRQAQQVHLSDTNPLPYDQLVVATGSTPIPFPADRGGTASGVLTLRTFDDARRLSDELGEAKRLLIIGGGYIGLEVAAAARARGVNVTLVEAGERILQRVALPETAAHYRQLHAHHGVTIREGTLVDRLETKDGRVVAGIIQGGERLEADLVVVGIGARPNTGLAESAGLKVGDGIEVDHRCRTNDQRIFAIGDCASFPMDQSRIRLQSVGNAIDMAEHAAAALLGSDTPFQSLPWFWSDQYDSQLQIAGLATGHTACVTRHDAPGASSHWLYRDDQLIAVEALNAPKTFAIAKRLLAQGKAPDPSLVKDAAYPTKALLKAPAPV